MAQDIPNKALVLVADGGKAVFFRNTGTGGEVSLREERRATLADFSNDGPSGSQPQDSSPKDTDEATFAKKLAQSLQTMKASNGFEALVIVADPTTLGQLRSALHKTVEAAVIHSLSKDLTNQSSDEIAKAIAK